MFVYLGTYTSGESEGIYLCRLDIEDGSLSTPELVAEMDNPTFLAIHSNERYLYAVSEVRKHGERMGGAASAFQRDPVSGSLSFLNSQLSGGSGPCHLNIDAAGRCLLVANYGSGSVSAFPLAEDGRLGEASAFFQHEGSSVNPQRQTGPHAHSANLSPDNRFVFICDLGLDRIMVYRLDAEKSMLTPAEKPWVEVGAGAGPRHFTFHPSGRSAYVINELDSTITAFSYAPETGELQEIETVSTLPEGFAGESTTAEILVSRDGRFLYGSNRGHDSIAIFAIDSERGGLSLVGFEPSLGKTPRNFAFEPGGSLLLVAHQDSDNVVTFRVDRETGRLAPMGEAVKVPMPVCVRFARPS